MAVAIAFDVTNTASARHRLRNTLHAHVNAQRTHAPMIDKKRKRKAPSAAATASATASRTATSLAASIHDAARRLHQRILQATDTANTNPPAPLPVLSATPTPPLPTLDLPASAAMTSAESSTSTHDTLATTASSQHQQHEGHDNYQDHDVKMETQVPSSQPPSLYEAVFGPQIALQLHNAAAVAQPKTPPATSQRSFQLGTPAFTPSTPRSTAATGISARLHRLSSIPQLGSPERARRGGPPVGIDPHNSPTLQHLQREDELAFSHPHQSYVILSPSTRKGVVRKATSSPALSPSKKQRRIAPVGEDDAVIGMLASMAEERSRSRATTPTRMRTPTRPHRAADEHTFADPRSFTPRRAQVMTSRMLPNGGATSHPPVTPPSRPIALPRDDGDGKPRLIDDDKEANLLLYLANSPRARQQPSTPRAHGHPATPTRSLAGSSTPGQQYYTPSLLDSLERRNLRHRSSSASGSTTLARTPQHQHRRTGSRELHGGRMGRTLFEEDEVASTDSPLPGSIDGLLAPPPALTPSGKRPTAAASTSPITPPHSGRLKHAATMGDNAEQQQRLASATATTSASMALDTPPATPAKQRELSTASRLGITQTPREIAAAWDTSSDEEAASGDEASGRSTARRESMSARARRASAALRMVTPDGLPTTPGGKQRLPRSRAPTVDGEEGQVPRTPSPAPTISSEPRTPHTPNTAAFAYSDFLNVSPSPNPGRSRVPSANGRFPSCNGHIVSLEDAMTWDDALRASGSASARRGSNRATTQNIHSTPTRQRQTSSSAALLTPGPILYYPSSPTFTVRGESSRRPARIEDRSSQARETTSPRSESRDSVALPLDAGFKEGFGRQVREEQQQQRAVSPPAASASPSLNVGLGLSY